MELIIILGYYVTNDIVVRNSILTDEGDPLNQLLLRKTINNLKSKNIFETVETEILDGSDDSNKIINIKVAEKPTGEISAGAGTGTSGSQLSFGLTENNYLGQGKKVKATATISDNALRGVFSITDPNFRNSDKALISSFENSQEDLMSKYGYETNKPDFLLVLHLNNIEMFILGLKSQLFMKVLRHHQKLQKIKKNKKETISILIFLIRYR